MRKTDCHNDVMGARASARLKTGCESNVTCHKKLHVLTPASDLVDSPKDSSRAPIQVPGSLRMLTHSDMDTDRRD